jgi:biopolymer transport protein ExbD
VAHSLVRGLYQMRVDSAVLAGSTTVLVSRNDAIDLRVVTLLDVVLIVLVVLVVLIAAVVGGGVMARRRRSAVNDDARSSTKGQTSPDVEVGSPS